MATTKEFNVHYQRIYSSEDEEGEHEREEEETCDLPPAVVTTKGIEKNGQWNHIENLDDFFIRIYNYHREQGFACLLLSSIFELVQYVFIVLFATFLNVCVDYKKLWTDKHPTFSKVIDWHKVENMPSSLVICLVVAFLFWMVQVVKVIQKAFKAWQMRNFYYNVLHIEDGQLPDMQWGEVQRKLMEVQQTHQISIHKKELSELDIHHRILRQKNYMIALQNKGVLPFMFNFPFVGKRTFLTEGLKYNLNGLLFKWPGAPFGNKWKLKSDYKDYGQSSSDGIPWSIPSRISLEVANLRGILGRSLSRRIFIVGFANLLFCPFILIYQVLHSFFTYAEMIKRSPDVFGARRWSQYGRIYLRHFNELEHEFQSRLCKAYEPASKYMNSFSAPILVIIARNIAFFAGAILAVLIGLSLQDADVLEAEHVMLTMAILGVVVKVCTGFIPNENIVFCPSALMKQILSHTHYIPDHWKGRAHTTDVRQEFSNLFQYKFVHLLEELMSPLLTPLILMFSVRYKAQQVIDFYRNFTVELTGVGDVCSFAQMDVRRHGNKQWFSYAEEQDFSEEQQAENGKTELSLLHFSIKNPRWRPSDSGKQFIETIKEHAISESIAMSQPLASVGPYDESDHPSGRSFPNANTSLMSLPHLSVHADLNLQLEEPNEMKMQETILNSSMLYMHDMHDKQRRDSSSIASSRDITAETLGLSRDDVGVKLSNSLPELAATEHFPFTSEQNQGGSWQENA